MLLKRILRLLEKKDDPNPALGAYLLLDDRTQRLVRMDLMRVFPFEEEDPADFEQTFSRAISSKPGFRSIFYIRCSKADLTRKARSLVNAAKRQFPPAETIEVWCDDIGGGLFIPHRYCVVAAERIGENVSISPGVVVGKNHGKMPIIEDEVRLCANATVIGGVTVGRRAVVGAGAVVTKDVPAKTTVVGNPAHEIVRHRSQGTG